eukprot:8546-Heterococcus_DN1.PRE.2
MADDQGLAYGDTVVLTLFDHGNGLSNEHCLVAKDDDKALLSESDLGEGIQFVQPVKSSAASSNQALALGDRVSLWTTDGKGLVHSHDGAIMQWSAAAAAAADEKDGCIFILEGINKQSTDILTCGRPFSLAVDALSKQGKRVYVCSQAKSEFAANAELQLVCSTTSEDSGSSSSSISRVWLTAEKSILWNSDNEENDDDVDEDNKDDAADVIDNEGTAATSSAVASITDAPTTKDDLKEYTQEHILGDGPLGLTLNRTDSGRVLIGAVAIGGQGSSLGMTAGATVCTVGTIDIHNKALNAQQWSDILAVIRTAPRPLRMKVIAVPVTDASVTTLQRQSSSSSQSNTTAAAATDSTANVSSDSNVHDDSGSGNDTSTDDDDSHGDSSSELQQHKHEFAQRELSQLLSQLQFPTANSSSNSGGNSPTITRQASMTSLADGTRSLVKRGPAKLQTTRMKLWTSLKPIDIILLSDTLLITTTADSTTLINTNTTKPTIVEAAVPLATAKIRVTQATATSQSGNTNSPTVSTATEYNFELLSPNGSYTISVDSSDAYEQWITVIADCIVHTIGYDSNSDNSSITTAGVRHRVIIGTLYNAAVTGDTIELSKLLKAASDNNTTSTLINQKDSIGLSAVDYAVRGAQVNTVSMLLAAGADVAGSSSTTADIGNGYTLLHYAAAAQHHVLLNMLLTHMNSSNNSGVSTVNARDKHGMTPLHVLTTTAKCDSDVNTTKQCITVLTAAGADIDLPIRDPYVKNSGISGSTALHEAAMRGQWWLVECLLKCGAAMNKGCMLPLALQSVKLTPVMTRRPSRSKSSDMHSDSTSSSTGSNDAVCSDYTALHLACLQCCAQPHSEAVDNTTTTTANTATDGDLPRTVEMLIKWGALPNTAANSSTALELLVAAHGANKQQQQQSQDDSTSSNDSGATVTAVVSLLLRNGARVSQELESKTAAILGSSSAMHACNTAFKNLAPFELSSYSLKTVQILNEDAWSSANSSNNTATCALCDAGFTLLRRRHHCRICGKSCCGPCSSRSVTSDTPSSSSSSVDNKHRCCDCCYNMLRYSTYAQYTKPVVNSTIKRQTSSSSSKSIQADDDSTKQTQELFSNADKKRSSDDKTAVTNKAGSGTGKLQQTMSEINDNMSLRGNYTLSSMTANALLKQFIKQCMIVMSQLCTMFINII